MFPAAATTTTPLATRRSHSSQIGVRPQAKLATLWGTERLRFAPCTSKTSLLEFR